MSVVACKILENGYEISADSILVFGSTQEKGEVRKFSKLFEANEVVVGGVGEAEELSLLQLFISTAKPYEETERAVLEFISSFNTWKKERTGSALTDANEYLLGFRGKSFNICGWNVNQITKFHAIGAGMNFALAALHLGHDTRSAVEVATELSIYCEKPIITIRKTTQ
jgi:ATP-dependent protease HslVU (ClpYQ) peptidase subunit